MKFYNIFKQIASFVLILSIGFCYTTASAAEEEPITRADAALVRYNIFRK